MGWRIGLVGMFDVMILLLVVSLYVLQSSVDLVRSIGPSKRMLPQCRGQNERVSVTANF